MVDKPHMFHQIRIAFEVPAKKKKTFKANHGAVDKFDNSSIDKNIQGEGEKKPDTLIG